MKFKWWIVFSDEYLSKNFSVNSFVCPAHTRVSWILRSSRNRMMDSNLIVWHKNWLLISTINAYSSISLFENFVYFLNEKWIIIYVNSEISFLIYSIFCVETHKIFSRMKIVRLLPLVSSYARWLYATDCHRT